jgi:hypothetical protein
MPEDCKLFSSEVMHRDLFMCNPTNTGHYEYPKFEDMSYDEGCHCIELRRFLGRCDPDKPDKYVVFYTRHTQLDGKYENKIVGYFKVGKQFQKPRMGFNSSETVLLPKADCKGTKYHSRGVPVEWGCSSVKKQIDNLLPNLIKRQDQSIAELYKTETNRIMNYMNDEDSRRRLVEKCEACGLLDLYRKKKC